MHDFLLIRYPGERDFSIQKGRFTALDVGVKPTGFVVSDFLHERIYAFQESESASTEEVLFHFSTEYPVVISRRDYQLESQAFLNSFPVLGVQKAVYSRVKQAQFDSKYAVNLFEVLCEAYPNTCCYLITSPLFGTWIGATPELLMKQAGMVCETVALAGTHGEYEEHDWTPKELEEHRFVVDAIQRQLEDNDCVDIESHGPYTHQAGPVKHLKTDFKALLTRPNAWSIALDLHPTPAVCGTPRVNALQAIESREMHQRDLYAGFIGWFEEGNTRLFVNLRCAQLFEQQAFLYVGGGYTLDSIPDMEWEETEKKSETLLRHMKYIQNTH